MKKFFFVVTLLFGFAAQAGMFGSDAPPADFLGLKVSAISASHRQVTFTISEFVNLLSDPSNGNTVSWEKSGEVWVLKLKHRDKMTDQTSKLGWEFGKSGGKAVVKRMSADDTVLSSDMEIMNGMLPYASAIEQLHTKRK